MSVSETTARLDIDVLVQIRGVTPLGLPFQHGVVLRRLFAI